jgi:hypothetical protein
MNHEVNVNIRQQEPVSVFWLLLFVAVVIFYWKWVLLIIGTLAALYLAWCLIKAARQDMAARRQMEADTRVRADRQLYGYMSGDPRATYGGWDDDDGNSVPE